ncbi:type II toxin-antitoxin system RelE/ParE family toxin [Methylorubrum extorquens]|uniref:type II toxin-antitoxin system RelE/ParE family toxin n=1 Tax=Methylorubrum extorquens TaxID=408 RepID=UPI001FCC3185|nr:type II toxin-antitoxin system RelE/ParE family toxin [Methylorubrum extorquens]
MDDPADHTSVVDALLTPGVCRKVRCDLCKLLVGQPELAHWLLPHPEEITGTPAKPNLWVRSLGLAEFPEGFPLVPLYADSGVRRRSYGSYLIFYRVRGERIEILHVMSGARDWESLLFPD